MEKKTIIRCFIASPGDTAEERDICEKVFSEINAGIGTAYGFAESNSKCNITKYF